MREFSPSRSTASHIPAPWPAQVLGEEMPMAVLSVLGGLDGGGDAGDGGSGDGGSGSGNGGGSGIVGGGSGGDVIGIDRNGDGDVDGDGSSGGSGGSGGESQAERGGGQAGVRRKRRHDQLSHDDDNSMSDWGLLDEGVEAGGVPAPHADGRSPGGFAGPCFSFSVRETLAGTFRTRRERGALLRRARAR